MEKKSFPWYKGHPPTLATLGELMIEDDAFPQKKEKKRVPNLLHEKQKVGLSRRVIRLACLPFCDGRITLLAWPTFLRVNTLARPTGSTGQSKRDNQSMLSFFHKLLAKLN